MTESNNLPRIIPSNDPNLIAYESFLQAIPEVDEGSYAGILSRLAEATSVYELDAPYQSESLAEWKDQAIIINSVRRAPSEFAEGLGVYLIVEFINPEDGMKYTCTTGAISIVAQLARAVTLDALPMQVIPRVAARPTKKGYYPQHLEIHKDQPKLQKPKTELPTAEEMANQPF